MFLSYVGLGYHSRWTMVIAHKHEMRACLDVAVRNLVYSSIRVVSAVNATTGSIH